MVARGFGSRSFWERPDDWDMNIRLAKADFASLERYRTDLAWLNAQGEVVVKTAGYTQGSSPT